jgi:hypothetical protein
MEMTVALEMQDKRFYKCWRMVSEARACEEDKRRSKEFASQWRHARGPIAEMMDVEGSQLEEADILLLPTRAGVLWKVTGIYTCGWNND